MRETLVEFLMEQNGYDIKNYYLLRPDGSVAAECKNGKWMTSATPYEIVYYNLFCGRGFPSRFLDKDYTNLGHK